jgi:hypothetical protein
MKRLMNKVRRAYTRGGLLQVARVACARLRQGRWQVDPHPPSGFDARWGTETEAVVDQLDLDTTGKANWAHALRYQPSEGGVLEGLVRITGILPEKWTFLDLGSGKGRQVLEAALLGIRRSVGVEFSEELHRMACRNLEMFRRHDGTGEITFHCGDAADYQLPDGPLVLYMYNPFGPPVMRRVAANVAARGGDVWVWYHSPQHPQCWDDAGFRRVPGGDGVRCVLWRNPL